MVVRKISVWSFAAESFEVGHFEERRVEISIQKLNILGGGCHAFASTIAIISNQNDHIKPVLI